MKTCNKCHISKYLTEFYTKQYRCKRCQVEYAKTWAKEHPDRAKATNARNRKKPSHKARKRAYDQAYAKANHDKRQAYIAKYNAENAEKLSAYHRAKRQRRKSYYLDCSRRYRARKKGAMGKHTAAEVKALVAEHDNKCGYGCGRIVDCLDHIIPLSKGGEDSVDNLLPACAPCNLSKGAKSVYEWLRTRKS